MSTDWPTILESDECAEFTAFLFAIICPISPTERSSFDSTYSKAIDATIITADLASHDWTDLSTFNKSD